MEFFRSDWERDISLFVFDKLLRNTFWCAFDNAACGNFVTFLYIFSLLKFKIVTLHLNHSHSIPMILHFSANNFSLHFDPVFFTLSRYSPLSDQQTLNWTVDGITLYNDHPYSCNKTTCSVSLDTLSSMSSGLWVLLILIDIMWDFKLHFYHLLDSYRCEISADAPSFAIDYTDQRMRVVGANCKFY